LRCHHQYLKHGIIRIDATSFLNTSLLALQFLPLHGFIFPGGRKSFDPVRPAGDPYGIPGP
jgi:hypothetical protein